MNLVRHDDVDESVAGHDVGRRFVTVFAVVLVLAGCLPASRRAGAPAEPVFVPTLRPDFDRRHLCWACEQHASRDRRYGGGVPNEVPGSTS